MSEFSPWVQEIQSKWSADIVSVRFSAPDEVEIKVRAKAAKAILKHMKEMQNGFIHLSDLTSYDESPKSPRFHVVYELISMAQKKRASVVAVLEDDKNPTMETLSDVWAGANWLEREVWDMMGIHFENHPDLRRLLMPEMFKGHPLRKDFDVNYRQEYPTARSKAPGFNPYLEGENA